MTSHSRGFTGGHWAKEGAKDRCLRPSFHGAGVMSIAMAEHSCYSGIGRDATTAQALVERSSGDK